MRKKPENSQFSITLKILPDVSRLLNLLYSSYAFLVLNYVFTWFIRQTRLAFEKTPITFIG